MIKGSEALENELVAHEELMAKQVRLEGDVIIIDIEYPYEIAIATCDTPEKLLGWIEHLLEKTWMTSHALRRFIRIAARQSSITIQH